jgi:hypothetical protein
MKKAILHTDRYTCIIYGGGTALLVEQNNGNFCMFMQGDEAANMTDFIHANCDEAINFAIDEYKEGRTLSTMYAPIFFDDEDVDVPEFVPYPEGGEDRHLDASYESRWD